MNKQAGIAVAVLAAALAAGCTPAETPKAAEVKDRAYAVTPDAVSVKAGLISGDLTDMKIIERVEDGSGRIVTPARLTGKLVLRNVSADQSVRLLAGKIVYMDMQGKAMAFENNRIEPVLKLSGGGSYSGSQDRLDPGQDSTQLVEAEVPAAALEGKKLKDIRVQLTYIPSSYRQEALVFPVSVKP